MRDIDYRLKCWYKFGCYLAKDGCERICPRYLEMNFLINNCGMTSVQKYLQQLQPDDIDIPAFIRLKEIKDNIVDFVQNGKNLFIESTNIQTGKTTWSLRLMYKFFDEIWSGNGFRCRGYYLYMPEFLTNIKNFSYRDTDEFKELDRILKTVDVVIWDDILGQELTPNEQNLIAFYIEKRINTDKCNIFNGTAIEGLTWEQILGKRIAQRLQVNCELVQLRGKTHKK